jgi:hypothetical protein
MIVHGGSLSKKPTEKRKCVYFCIAIMTSLLLSQCATLERSPGVQNASPQIESRQHLIRARGLFVQGDHESALEENKKALSLSGQGPPGDEALYYMALIHADPRNPKRDCMKSIATFKRAIKECPRSAWTEQAKVWVQIVQEDENAKRSAASLSQENDKLKRIIEESKKVDIEINEKKRDKTR